jgi:hypothetical protein
LTQSNEKLNKYSIGEIIYNGEREYFSINSEKVRDILSIGEYEAISIDVNPYEICSLSNGNFISTNSDSLTIFDENFKQIKKLDIQIGHVFGCSVSKKISFIVPLF